MKSFNPQISIRCSIFDFKKTKKYFTLCGSLNWNQHSSFQLFKSLLLREFKELSVIIVFGHLKSNDALLSFSLFQLTLYQISEQISIFSIVKNNSWFCSFLQIYTKFKWTKNHMDDLKPISDFFWYVCVGKKKWCHLWFYTISEYNMGQFYLVQNKY